MVVARRFAAPLLLAALPLLPLAAGCGLLRDPTAIDHDLDALNVHSLLVAGADTVAVLVTTVDVSSAATEAQLTPVPGAAVTISDGAETVTLGAQPDGPDRCIAFRSYLRSPGIDLRAGCYTAVFPGGIRSGSTYDLTIEAPDGRTVTGTATVPGTPRIVEPVAGAELPARSPFGDFTAPPPPSFEVRWADAPADRWTALAVEPTDPSCDVLFLAGPQLIGYVMIEVTGLSAQAARAHAGSCQEGRRDRVDATLVVATFDSVYTRYARDFFDRDTAPLRRASAGLTGAFGVFAGAARASVDVVFLPQ